MWIHGCQQKALEYILVNNKSSHTSDFCFQQQWRQNPPVLKILPSHQPHHGSHSEKIHFPWPCKCNYKMCLHPSVVPSSQIPKPRDWPLIPEHSIPTGLQGHPKVSTLLLLFQPPHERNSEDLTSLENVQMSAKVISVTTHTNLKLGRNQWIAKYFWMKEPKASLQRAFYTLTACFWSSTPQLKLLATFLQLKFQVLTLGWQFGRLAVFSLVWEGVLFDYFFFPHQS